MAQIGIDARMIHYRVGGISTTIRGLVKALEACAPPHDVTLFHSRKMRESISQRFRRVSLWTPPHHRLERAALTLELLPHRLDIFHATDFIPPLGGARRFVISVYDLAFLRYPQFLTTESRRYYNGQIQTAVRQAAHILTISQASKRDIVDLLNVPPERVSVHLLAADDDFAPQPAAACERVRSDLNLPERFFLFFGTFEPRKNIDGLLAGYRRLLERLPDAPALVLAGSRGWLFDETMRRIEALKLGERVLWREHVPRAQQPALYSAALALVLVSHYEGFGLPPLEAMACGTLPIVSDRSSLPEVVGDVGARVDPDDADALADALYRAAVDDTWRREQGAAGIARAKQFTWAAAARTTLAAYERVL